MKLFSTILIMALFHISSIGYAMENKTDQGFCDSHYLGLDGASSTRKNERAQLGALILLYGCNYKIRSISTRSNLNFGGFFGNKTKQYNQFIIGASQDIVVNISDNLYGTLGFGTYLKSKKTNRISSHFTFGERVSLGYSISEDSSVELFYRHFSNADLTDENSGQDFLGLSLSY